MADSKPSLWEELRKPFPADVIGKLPRGNTTLDFVGHAAVTDRLNTVVGADKWNWEPLAFDENGLPRLDSKGNLWIKLIITDGEREVIRLGYGDGSSSMKELIGDALRNAAMRFGVALDLWSKDELESTLEDPSLKNQRATGASVPRPAVGSASEPAPESMPATTLQKQQIVALLRGQGVADEQMAAVAKLAYKVELKTLTKAQAADLITEIKAKPVEVHPRPGTERSNATSRCGIAR